MKIISGYTNKKSMVNYVTYEVIDISKAIEMLEISDNLKLSLSEIIERFPYMSYSLVVYDKCIILVPSNNSYVILLSDNNDNLKESIVKLLDNNIIIKRY